MFLLDIGVKPRKDAINHVETVNLRSLQRLRNNEIFIYANDNH